jgi:hypothetical protein
LFLLGKLISTERRSLEGLPRSFFNGGISSSQLVLVGSDGGGGMYGRKVGRGKEKTSCQ